MAVVEVRAVTRGTISMAAHALLLLLAGKVAVGTIVQTLILVKEVILVTLWEMEERNSCLQCSKKTLKSWPENKLSINCIKFNGKC